MGIFGIIYLLVGETFLSLLLKAFGATTDVFPYAKQYASITLIGMPFLIVTNGMSNLIRADGKPKYSMVCMVMGAIINTILDPIFIFACDWGIAGAAWATVIGQIFSFILALRYLWRFQTIHFEKESFLLDIKESMKICSMGISSSSNQIAVTVIQIIQYNSLTYYGALTKYGTDIPLAACGIVMKTNAIILAIVVGISQGTQPIIGFNYGARQYHRVREAYLLAVKWNLVVSTIAFIAFQFFPQSIISLFGDGDELYFEFAVLFMRTYLFMVLVNGVQLLSSSFFTAIGKSLRGALLALTRQTFFLIQLTLLLQLCQPQVGSVGLCTLHNELIPVEPVELLRVAHEKTVGDYLFRRIAVLLAVKSVRAAEVRNTALGGNSGAAVEYYAAAFVYH